MIIAETVGENGFGARIDGAVAQLLFGTGAAALVDQQGLGEPMLMVHAQGSIEPGTTTFAFRLSDLVPGVVLSTQAAAFQISGIDNTDRFGGIISSAGDIDGDGYEDLFISASGARPLTMFSTETNGEAYIISGAKLFVAAQLNEVIELSSIFPTLDD
jgi:hypothetical protein